MDRLVYSLLPLLSLVVPFFIGILHLFVYPFEFMESFFKKIAKIALLFGTCLTLIVVVLMVPYILVGEVLEVPQLSL